MAFTNSPLVSYTRISPNRTVGRNHKIDTITIHCVCGQCTLEGLGSVFAPTSRQASSNYGISKDGKVGMYCEEKDRAWTTSSASNDHRAVTIEVASDTYHPYAVNSAAYNTLIELVADICKRNGIKKLMWRGDKSLIGQVNKQKMTAHRWFAATSCPGDYLYSRFGDIANKVNAKLGASSSTETAPTTPSDTQTSTTKIKSGDKVKIASGATYYNGKSIPSWVINNQWVVNSVSGNRVVVDKSVDGKHSINSPIDAKYLTVVGSISSGSSTPTASYLVKITASVLNVRKGPGTNYGISTTVRNGGVYTIVAESTGTGATKWGKLKSGAGWISLDYVTKV